MTWHRSKVWKQWPLWYRLTIVWRVLRTGLPRIEVEYVKIEHDDGTVTLSTWLQYPGEVHCRVEGEDNTSVQGTFEIIQRLDSARSTDS